MRTLTGTGFIALAIPVFMVGCVRVKTEPIRVEPIYIEITINHRVQEALDDLFADLDQASQTAEYEPLEVNKADREK